MNKRKITDWTLEDLEILLSNNNEKIPSEKKFLNFIVDLFWTLFSREGGTNV